MRHWRLSVFALVLLSLGLVLPTAAQDAPLRVIATYSILGDLVQNVAGDSIDLTVLVGPDADSHVYEPTPQDAVALAEADLIFENGLDFETWLDDLYTASGSTATRVVVSDGIEPLALTEHKHGDHEHADETTDAHADEHADEAADEAGDHDHEHGEFDPHIWHDPNHAIVMVENIRAALAVADAANADVYNTNAEAYTADLLELDAYIRAQVDSLPAENRVLITAHDTFAYFGAAYGLEVSSALASVSTEAADPSAGELAELIGFIQAEGVPAIFAENITNPELMQRIADEAGVSLAPTLYTDALGQPGTPGATYLELVRYNVDTIITALQGR